MQQGNRVEKFQAEFQTSRGNWKKMFHSQILKKNETCTGLLLDIKHFYYALKRKHFVQNVQASDISPDFVMLPTIKEGPRLESWSVVQCTLLNKDLLTRLNTFFTTQR